MCTVPLALTALVAAATAASHPGVPEARATVRGYFEAILRGDADAALALVSDPSDADRIVVRASAAREKALERVEDLARSRFGSRGDLGIAARHRRLLRAVGRAPVQRRGDRAVVRPEGERPVWLRREDGAWKLESPADRLTGEERQALQEALQKSERAARELGDRIRSGAVRDAQEARAWLRNALGHDDEHGPPRPSR